MTDSRQWSWAKRVVRHKAKHGVKSIKGIQRDEERRTREKSGLATP